MATEKGIFGGIFDGKAFDLFRGDEGDANAAARQAARQEAKAAATRARAESLEASLNDVETGPEAAATGGITPAGRAVVDVANSPWARKTRQRQKQLLDMCKDQQEQLEELTEMVKQNRQYTMKLRDATKAMKEKVAEKFKKEERNLGFISDNVLSIGTALVEVININDTVHNPLARLGAVAVGNVIKSDYVEGNNEKMLRGLELLLQAFAYYDASVGLTSLLTTDGGALLPSTTTTVGGAPSNGLLATLNG